MVKEFNIDNFDQEVLQSGGKVLVKFSSPTCGPCRMMVPVLKQAVQKWPNVSFGEVNVADERELAVRYGIRAVPTLMFFDKGEIKGQHLGYIDLDDMEHFFGAMFDA